MATGVMTEQAMEQATPRGAFVAFRYKGMLVDVVAVTKDPTEAARLYREGVKGHGRKARAMVHLYARPL